MSRMVVHGIGAVSPAGWSVASLHDAMAASQPLPLTQLARPDGSREWQVRRVPAPPSPFPWMRNPRLRRVSPISRFATAAALEALGDDEASVRAGSLRLGIVFCVMAGCVNYSSRFYQEVMADPSTASPLVFPETVFNAPASHLAALLGTSAINYTQVGDDTAFIEGLATAAGWLETGRIDACLVIGAEECDWLTCDAMALFEPQAVLSEGAGAVYLKRAEHGIAIEAITSPQQYSAGKNRDRALREVRAELESNEVRGGVFDSATTAGSRLWADWPGARTSVRTILGNAFNAASAWQVIAAAAAVEKSGGRALIPVAGCNQAAIGLRLAWS